MEQHPPTSSSHHQPPPTKRRKLSHPTPYPCHLISSHNIISKWRTSLQQHLYSTTLLRSLRRHPSSSSSHVRHAADRALAVSAKASTRWSRAILKRRRRLTKVKKLKVTGHRRFKTLNKGGVQKRVRVLSRLVPGCGKLSFPNLLEEVTDYIAALEMQVRAMASLAKILTRPTGAADSEV